MHEVNGVLLVDLTKRYDIIEQIGRDISRCIEVSKAADYKIEK